MVTLFQQHVGAELAGDLDTAMAALSEHPHLNHAESARKVLDPSLPARAMTA